jgi:hypothetical protein
LILAKATTTRATWASLSLFLSKLRSKSNGVLARCRAASVHSVPARETEDADRVATAAGWRARVLGISIELESEIGRVRSRDAIVGECDPVEGKREGERVEASPTPTAPVPTVRPRPMSCCVEGM